MVRPFKLEWLSVDNMMVVVVGAHINGDGRIYLGCFLSVIISGGWKSKGTSGATRVLGLLPEY